jgi:hypothetical protein
MTSPDCAADAMTDHDLNLPVAVAGRMLATFWVGPALVPAAARRSPLPIRGSCRYEERAAAALPEQGGKPIALRLGCRSFKSLR